VLDRRVKMKRNLAIALCLIGIVGIFGVGITGSLDATQAFAGDEGLSGMPSGSWEPEGVAVPPARVAKTGQTTRYGARDDGQLRRGVAWPVPRFTDNGNGTVRDNLTGLTWLKDANCTAFYSGDTTNHNNRNWVEALKAANKLADGYCGLTDGSVAGKWRLPNVKELYSLIDFAWYLPAIPNTEGTGQWSEGNPFTGVQWNGYWSSSTHAYYSNYAWFVYLTFGSVGYEDKTNDFYVWPVR